MIIEIPGEPVAQKRHRHYSGKNFNTIYNPCAKEKEIAQKYMIANMKVGILIEAGNPVSLKIKFCIKIPESWSARKKLRTVGSPCTKRPDIDNYIVFIFNAMSGIIFHDDAQICEISAIKLFDFEPKTIIHVNEKGD